jgi:hypothetical protein
MAIEDGLGHASPSWFTAPGETDILAWVALALICLALYGIVTLYGAFDRWAEHRAKGTPLAKTIPTLLIIALLYEIFPLEHFHIFLPLTAVLIALMADWSRFHMPDTRERRPETDASLAAVTPEPSDEIATVIFVETEEARND